MLPERHVIRRLPERIPQRLDGIVQLDDQLVEKLDEIAERTNVSRSELLRRAAQSVIDADEWALADKRLIEGYTRYPPDPLLLQASERLAAETAPAGGLKRFRLFYTGEERTDHIVLFGADRPAALGCRKPQ